MSETVCVWKQEEYKGDYWESECGLAWSLIDGSPKCNGMDYCPKCGKPLIQDFAEDDMGGEE